MSGRRVYRGRGRTPTPMAFLLMLVVIIVATLLVIVNIRQDRAEKVAGDDAADPVATDTVATDTEPADEPTPAPAVVEKVEVFGDTQQYDAVYRVGDTGFEMYTYMDGTAQKYAQCVNQAADDLAGKARVFCLPVPLSSGITLPDELWSLPVFSDQTDAEDSILGYMNGNVIGVPVHDALMQHRTEYVYYRTDHHWTGLGAYYCYREFCAAAGLNPNDETAYEKKNFDGFLGTFYNDTGKSDILGSNPDTVTAYVPIGDAYMNVYGKDGSELYSGVSVICDESSAPAGIKYGAYLWGDNAYSVITNNSINENTSCVLVKESFGNAFAPFLVDHYRTVYVIDYRYWSGSLKNFVTENGVQDVIFCNNLSAIRNTSLIGNLHGIL